MGNLPFLGPALVINEDGDLLERCSALEAMAVVDIADKCRERVRNDDSRIADHRLRAPEIREALQPSIGDEAVATLLEYLGLRNNFTDKDEEEEENSEGPSVDAGEIFGPLVAISSAMDLEQHCDALFRIRWGPASPKLNDAAVVSLLARITKGVHTLFLLEAPPLKLVQKFVADRTPEDGRWTPRALARAISDDPYATSYFECLQNPVDGQQLARDCRRRYMGILIRISNAGSEHKVQNENVMADWSDDENEPETSVRDMPLFDLTFDEVTRLWKADAGKGRRTTGGGSGLDANRGIDPEVLVEAVEAAIKLCASNGVSYSKSVEESENFEHEAYIYRTISSEDLQLLAVPVIAFQALDPRRSGRLPHRLCADLAALCAEISEDYDSLTPEELQAASDPRLGIQTSQLVSSAAAWAISRERMHYENQLRRRFVQYDKDGSGDIDGGEFEDVIQSLIGQFIVPQTERQRMMMEDVGQLLADEMMSVVDKDNSGKVDFDEFRLGVRLLHSKFKEMRRAFGNTTSLLEVVDVVLRELVQH